jgi:iron(III) transport system substrate-binding protein
MGGNIMTQANGPKAAGPTHTVHLRRLAGATALLLGISMIGWSEPGHSQQANDEAALAAIIDAAKKEGVLEYYVSESDDVNVPVIKRFTEKYGIPVRHQRASSGLLTQRFAAERAAGVINADVVDAADPFVFNNKPEWFVTLSPEVVPGLATYPKAVDKDTGYGWLPKYVELRTNLATIQYNTDLVKDPPKTWEDLLDPTYKGKVLLSSPKATPSYMGWAELMRRRYGIEYLQKIRALDFKLVDSAGPGGQQVAAGAYKLNFPAATTHSLQLIKQGAPIARVIMSDPSHGPEQNVAIVAGAPHPNVARLFVNFMVQPETQDFICELTGGSGVLAGKGPGKAEKCLELPKDLQRIPYADLDNKSVTQPLLDALGIQ